MKPIKRIFKVVSNKYLIAITVFLVWLLFFDSRDVFTQMERKKELQGLLESKRFFEQEISIAKKQLSDIQNNAAALEKVAREKYKMKKPGEEIFLVEEN